MRLDPGRYPDAGQRLGRCRSTINGEHRLPQQRRRVDYVNNTGHFWAPQYGWIHDYVNNTPTPKRGTRRTTATTRSSTGSLGPRRRHRFRWRRYRWLKSGGACITGFQGAPTTAGPACTGFGSVVSAESAAAGTRGDASCGSSIMATGTLAESGESSVSDPPTCCLPPRLRRRRLVRVSASELICSRIKMTSCGPG